MAIIDIEWCKQLPDGSVIKESEILSPFSVYRDCRTNNRFLLIPQKEQRELRNVVIFANRISIRLICFGGWPKSMLTNVQMIIQCPQNKRLELIVPDALGELKGMICEKLLNLFEYQNIEGKWILKLK